MDRSARVVCRTVSLALLLVTLAARALPATPVEVYGRLPSLEKMAISPDGTKLAFVRTNENTRTLVIMSLADKQVLGGGMLGDAKLRGIEWADDEHLLLLTSVTGPPPPAWMGPLSELYSLATYDLASGKVRSYPELLPDVRMTNWLSGTPLIRHNGEDTLVYFCGQTFLKGFSYITLFRLNLRTNVEQKMHVGATATQAWMLDDAGEIVAEQDYYERERRWEIRIVRNGLLSEAVSHRDEFNQPRILGLTQEGDALLVDLPQENIRAWRSLSLRDGTVSPLAAGLKAEYLTEPLVDPHTRRVIGGVYIADAARYVFFDPAIQKRWDLLTSAFAGEWVTLESASADLTRFVVKLDGTRHGYSYELVDTAKKLAFPLGNVYVGVEQRLEVRRINYEAADGLSIPAYLTLPPNRQATKLPLIVLPHADPTDRDTAQFDWWSQALASQGYAVLSPNYRGSDLGWDHLSAGFGEWGRKMQTDLSDGVRYLADQGIIDPKRVCIAGAGYGGYAALAGVTLDPGVYRCAISLAGIADLRAFLKKKFEWSRDPSSAEQRLYDRYLGAKGPDDPVLDTISPARHIDRITVPVLLIHGRDDTVVPYEQSEIMLRAMKQAGKNVELVTMRNEDHWLSRSETRLQMLQSSIAFLKANNPPD